MMKYSQEDIDVMVVAWAEDFAKALLERPKWMRPFIRFFMGKYAFREFVGMCQVINCLGDPDWSFCWLELGYGLENTNYSQESVSWSDCFTMAQPNAPLFRESE